MSFNPAGYIMQITVNGKLEELTESVSIQEFLSQKDISGDRIVIERNKNIAKRDTWAATLLAEGDHLEIVQFVGGG